MNSPTVRMHYGDTYPFVFRITRRDPENVDMEIPVDLTNCNVFFTMKNTHTNDIIIDMASCNIKNDPNDGWVEYVFPTIDIPRGMYNTRFIVVDDNSGICSYPLYDNQMIHII